MGNEWILLDEFIEEVCCQNVSHPPETCLLWYEFVEEVCCQNVSHPAGNMLAMVCLVLG